MENVGDVLAIVGSRHFNDWRKFRQVLARHVYGASTIVSGAALGVDSLAARLARTLDVALVEYPADWKTHGKAAGMLRNTQIVALADRVVALPCQCSRGTYDTIHKARKAGVPVVVVEVDCGRKV